MYPIKYPVEAFFWRLHDGRGNAEIEVRDADRRTVFFMRIKGRAMDESTRLKDELVPLIAKLLNEHALSIVTPITPAEILPEPTPEAIDNPGESEDYVRQTPKSTFIGVGQLAKRKRGRPKKT